VIEEGEGGRGEIEREEEEIDRKVERDEEERERTESVTEIDHSPPHTTLKRIPAMPHTLSFLPVIREYAVVSRDSKTECATRGEEPFPRVEEPLGLLGMFPADASRSDCSDEKGAWEEEADSRCDFLLDLQSLSAMRNIT
jgi:hypothetical protein